MICPPRFSFLLIHVSCCFARCGPCRQFTPQLKQTYNTLREAEKPFEVIFVSSDKNMGEFQGYFSSMPWLAVAFNEAQQRKQLGDLCGVRGIPTLVLFDEEGNVINGEGRTAVLKDPKVSVCLIDFPFVDCWDTASLHTHCTLPAPQGENFPWGAGDVPPSLSLTESTVLRFSCEQLATAAVKESEASRLDASVRRLCRRYLFVTSSVSISSVP